MGTSRMIVIDVSKQSESLAKHKLKPDTLRRMLRFSSPYLSLLSLFLIVVLLDATIGIVNPLIYRQIINQGILKGDATLVVHSAILAGILGILDSTFSLAQTYISSKIGAGIVLSLRTKLFEHIQRMPLAFFIRAQTGALVSRLNSDVTGAQSAFTEILSNVVGNIFTVVLVLGAMFTLSWQITLLALVLFPLFILPGRLMGRKLKQIVRESYDITAAMNTIMVERFNAAGAQLAKLFGRAEDERKMFEIKAARVSDISVTRSLYGSLFFAALTLMSSFATAVAYGWGGVLSVRHKLDVGTVVAFVSYLARLYGPLNGLSNIQNSIMTALVSFERVFEVLDLQPIIKESPLAVPPPEGPLGVSFDHVSFRYPAGSEVSLASFESSVLPDKAAEKKVLVDVTFKAEPGHLVALVGPSGGGKTTITHLITRLYDVQSGSVSINGIDIRNMKIEALHQRIGVVTQDAHFFNDTIRANLQYAKHHATDEEITEALRAAQILPLIASLPSWLDTLVGERGYRFSGGEKQRLAIARVLLRSPDIVILDEATAHLDSGSEAAIQLAFDSALHGRTSIVIAHRLSTILKADLILVIQEGNIVERGNHAELVEQRGLYSELYRRQFSHVV